MNKIMKRVLLCLAGCLVICGALAGCGSKASFHPTVSSLYISDKGEISTAFIVDVDQDYYSKEDMLAFCEEEVIAYNQAKGATAAAYQKEAAKDETLPVAIDSLTYSDKATLILNYATADDYVAFNQKDDNAATSVMYAAAKNTTGLPDTTFVSVEDGSTISSSSVIGDSKLKIVMIQGQVDVQVGGSLVYVSGNVQVTGSNEAITGQDGYSYLIFK
jgi:hypothetical protein